MSSRHQVVVHARPEDLDDLGHVGNQVYLRWVLDAAVAHSTSVGWDLAAYQRCGGVFVVRRHELDYRGQVRAGDAIDAETWVETWKAASCLRRTTLRRGEAVVLEAATTWAYLAWPSGRPQRIPDELREAFA